MSAEVLMWFPQMSLLSSRSKIMLSLDRKHELFERLLPKLFSDSELIINKLKKKGFLENFYAFYIKREIMLQGKKRHL